MKKYLVYFSNIYVIITIQSFLACTNNDSKMSTKNNCKIENINQCNDSSYLLSIKQKNIGVRNFTKDLNNVNNDFLSLKDTIIYEKFYVKEHYKIIQYSGQNCDPPTRWFVYFYGNNNSTILYEFRFPYQNVLFDSIEYKYNSRQKLLEYCKERNKKKENN